MRWGSLLLALLLAPSAAATEPPTPPQLTPEIAQPRCAVAVRVTNGNGRTVFLANGPVTLEAEVRVEPRDANRLLVIAWDFDDRPVSLLGPADDSPEAEPRDGATGSTQVALAGATERRVFQRRMNDLSGGNYKVVATVYEAGTRRGCSASTTVRVTSKGY